MRQRSEADQARWLKEFETRHLEISPASIREMDAVPFADGATAQVFRATFESTIVAVKSVNLSRTKPKDIESMRNRFKTEAAVQSSLHSRKIVKVYGACTTKESRLLLIMESVCCTVQHRPGAINCN